MEEIEEASQATDKHFAWQQKPATSTTAYWVGCVLGLLLLLAQVQYFLGYALTQNTTFRPYLSSLSQLIQQPLPLYQNTSEFSVIGTAFSPLDKGKYHLQVSFINHADFPQAYPNLKLELQNLQGGPFAQRNFTPSQYLAQTQKTPLLAPNQTLDIDLTLSVPNASIGGYLITLQPAHP